MRICKRNILKFLLVLVALGCFMPARCQYIYTRQYPGNAYFGPVIEEVNSQNLIVCSTTQTQIPSTLLSRSNATLLKVDAGGNLLDSLQLDSNFVVTSNILAVGGHYYLGGLLFKYFNTVNVSCYPLLLKVDLNLNVVKKQVLDSTYNKLIAPVKMANVGNRIYTGRSVVSSPQIPMKLFKMDLDLNKLDSAMETGSQLLDLVAHENNLLMSGLGFNAASLSSKAQVAKMDTVFNISQRFNLDSLGYISACGQKIGLGGETANLQSLGSGKYCVSGNGFVTGGLPCTFLFKTITSVISGTSVVKTHILGMPNKSTTYESGAFASSKRYNSVYSLAFVLSTNGSYSVPQNEHTYMLIHKIDTSGALKWEKNLGGDMYYYPTSVYATSDSAAVVCGIRYDSAAPKVINVGEPFIMKVDRNGNQVLLGIKENGRLNANYHKCYPDPAANAIAFDIPFQDTVTVVIYDELGREKKRIAAYANHSQVDVSALGAGLYSYRLLTPIRVYSGKFIKE